MLATLVICVMSLLSPYRLVSHWWCLSTWDVLCNLISDYLLRLSTWITNPCSKLSIKGIHQVHWATRIYWCFRLKDETLSNAYRIGCASFAKVRAVPGVGLPLKQANRLYRYIMYNIDTLFVSSKHSHWLMVVDTILLRQITKCSLVGRWSFWIMTSKQWCSYQR